MATAVDTRVEERLRREEIVWLDSVRPDGRPHNVPVWFLWDGESLLIYTEPGAQKVKNIRANPRVALNLNSDPHGGEVVRMDATAEILADPPPVSTLDSYVEKYRRGIQGLGMTPETMAQQYSAAIRVTPTKVQAW